jgi:preprotein translocase subunit SecG
MLQGLIILHVIICVLLIAVVLLQFGKGAEVGAVMGGGSSQNIFSSSSKGNFFTNMTTVLAVTFMATSISISLIKAKSNASSVFDTIAPTVKPLNSDSKADPTKPVDATKTETKTKK